MLTPFPIRWMPALALRWAWYTASQYRSAESLGRYADARLRALVRHAGRHVPYYRNLFRSIGFDPETFRGRADMDRIPLLDKETVRTRWAELIADNAERFHPVWKETSGSTGTPLRFQLSASSRVNDAAATLRAYAWAGFLPGMRVVSVRAFMKGWLLHSNMAGRSLNVAWDRLTAATRPTVWQAIDRQRPVFMHGYPSALMLLAAETGPGGRAHHRPRAIISIGESLPAELKQRLAEAYGGARVFDFYSLSENNALITECRQGALHVHDDYAWHEWIDPKGGAIRQGRGEVVGTSYYNYAMPLIRYRTRDFVRLPKAPAPCACGRSFRRVASIEGRMEDFVRTPSGDLINLFEEPMNEGRGIMCSQYVQEEEGRLRVHIVPGPDYDPACLPMIEAELKRRLGPGMSIEFRTVSELERRSAHSGKTPFVLSRLGHGLYADAEGGAD